MGQPCGCAGTKHELKCFIGLLMMQSTVSTLSWILDENPEMDDFVADMQHDADAAHARNN